MIVKKSDENSRAIALNETVGENYSPTSKWQKKTVIIIIGTRSNVNAKKNKTEIIKFVKIGNSSIPVLLQQLKINGYTILNYCTSFSFLCCSILCVFTFGEARGSMVPRDLMFNICVT